MHTASQPAPGGGHEKELPEESPYHRIRTLGQKRREGCSKQKEPELYVLGLRRFTKESWMCGLKEPTFRKLGFYPEG